MRNFGTISKNFHRPYEGMFGGGSTPPTPTADRLCFTANTAGSTVKLTKTGSPTVVSLETSTDGNSWSDYTIGDTITLSNIGDKVYWRNKSETDTGFSTGMANYYKFAMSGSVAGSGDVCYLLNKNSTNSAPINCFCYLFRGITVLTKAPDIMAETLGGSACNYMFEGCTGLIMCGKINATSIGAQTFTSTRRGCSNLIALPAFSVVSIGTSGFYQTFRGCTKIKISETQDSDYTQPYRVPMTGTTSAVAGYNDFMGTGGTYTGALYYNTTYYLHKDNVIV